MSKDKKGGKQNRPGKEVEDQWKDDFSRDHRFIHSVSGPFTPPTKGKEPSQSGPTSDSDAQGGSASKRSKTTNLPAGAPSSPGGKGVGNNAGKGPTPS